MTLVPIAPFEVAAAYESVEPEQFQPLYVERSDRFRLGEGAEGESLERTLRAAVAIEDLHAGDARQPDRGAPRAATAS